MILEEATKEAYGYYPKDLKPQSNKCIVTVCFQCGEIRHPKKENYRYFCHSCSTKLNNSYKGIKNIMFGRRRDLHPRFIKRSKCICLWCGKEFEILPRIQQYGWGKYCCGECRNNAQKRKVSCICFQCGKVFTTTPSRIKQGCGKHCCIKCLLKSQKGLNNPNYKGGEEAVKARKELHRRGHGYEPIYLKPNDGNRWDYHHIDFTRTVPVLHKIHNAFYHDAPYYGLEGPWG